jgi:hypothetical protein
MIAIDELVLELPPCDHRLVCEALSAELTRLIAERGLPAHFVGGGAPLARAPVLSLTLSAGESPESIGASAALAVYRGLASGARVPPGGAREHKGDRR